MTSYPYRAQWVWIASLVLIWLALWSPCSTGWNVVVAMGVIAIALAGIAIATRRIRARRRATGHVLAAIDAALGAVPSDIKRNTPLVLTVSDASSLRGIAAGGWGTTATSMTTGMLTGTSGTELVRITEAAIWVRCDEPQQLMHLADALKHWRDGQGPDAVAYLVAADWTDTEEAFATSLKRWRIAIDEASRAVGYRLPVCVAIYAEEAHAAADECPWFGVSGASPVQIATLPTQVAASVARYTRMTIPMLREPRAHRSAQLDALTRWACQAILPALVEPQRGSSPLRVTAFGVTEIEGRPAPASLYGQFVTQTTGLTLPTTDGIRLSYPLPAPLIRGIPAQSVERALPRALAHAFVSLTVVFCAAAATSAWQNRALVQRVANDMSRYQALAPAQDAARVDALQALKRDRDELDRYARVGVPPRLGLGFYRGAPQLPLTQTLIASYQAPAPAPATIELDSLSLFNTGRAALNPGSNRVLVGALEMIKAHPDKRVLVAGHTDSIGDLDSNFKLSEARAAAVRNWLADASGIPPSHFAIQGYGETRPKDANDTEAGRAANRRVEITLIPDCRDEGGSPTSPQGQPACSFE